MLFDDLPTVSAVDAYMDWVVDSALPTFDDTATITQSAAILEMQ